MGVLIAIVISITITTYLGLNFLCLKYPKFLIHWGVDSLNPFSLITLNIFYVYINIKITGDSNYIILIIYCVPIIVLVSIALTFSKIVVLLFLKLRPAK